MTAYELVYALLHRGEHKVAEYVADNYEGDVELEACEVAEIISLTKGFDE